MTDQKNRLVRTTDDLRPGHWMKRQLPPGASLRGYAEDRAIVTLTKAAQEAIDGAGLSRTEVAQLLGTTKSYVSQILNGSANMTLKTLGALLWVGGKQITGLESEELGTRPRRDNVCYFVSYTTDECADALVAQGSAADVARVENG